MVHADNTEIIVDRQPLQLLKSGRLSLIPGVCQRVDVPGGPRRGTTIDARISAKATCCLGTILWCTDNRVV